MDPHLPFGGKKTGHLNVSIKQLSSAAENEVGKTEPNQ